MKKYRNVPITVAKIRGTNMYDKKVITKPPAITRGISIIAKNAFFIDMVFARILVRSSLL